MEGCRQVVFIIIENRVHTSVYGIVLLLSLIFSNSTRRICVGSEGLHTSLFSKSVTDSNRRGAVDEVRPGVRCSTAGLCLASLHSQARCTNAGTGKPAVRTEKMGV